MQLYVDGNGIQRLILEGSLSIDADTGLPVCEVIWDTDSDGPISEELQAQVGGLKRTGDVLGFDQAAKDADDAAKALLAAEVISNSKLAATQSLSDGTPLSRLQQAFAAVVLSEINTLRALHSLAPRTPEWFLAAVSNRISL